MTRQHSSAPRCGTRAEERDHRLDALAHSVPQADPLTAMGVVDSNMVVEHDSRRKPFPLWQAHSRRRGSLNMGCRASGRLGELQREARRKNGSPPSTLWTTLWSWAT